MHKKVMEFWIWRICGHVSLETFVDDKETPKWYIIRDAGIERKNGCSREVLGREFETNWTSTWNNLDKLPWTPPVLANQTRNFLFFSMNEERQLELSTLQFWLIDQPNTLVLAEAAGKLPKGEKIVKSHKFLIARCGTNLNQSLETIQNPPCSWKVSHI